MKEVSGSLRLDLAAFRELEAFAQFGTDLDPASQRQLDRGARMVALLKQGQFVPYDTIDQVISIFAGTKGLLDDVPVAKVLEFEKALLEHFRGAAKATREKIASAKSFKGLEDEVIAAVKECKKRFGA
jgi:F-type H+-transporting ATPase subunit alpha